MSAEQLGYTAPETRFVIYSDRRGVYLGGGVWATDDTLAKSKNNAPTYRGDVDLRAVVAGAPDARLVQVFPSQPGNTASKEDIKLSSLLVW